MGRVTYEQMAAYWPAATGDCAPPMNNIPKVVFSKRLRTAEWISSRIARGDLTEEITALKSESGGDIIAHGGATFVQALSRLRLIDEYRLVVLPVALGSGLPLFRDLAGPLRLDLVEARRFPGADGHPHLPDDQKHGVTRLNYGIAGSEYGSSAVFAAPQRDSALG
jgi:dihydrofolate reductase